jgi:hypothetical protein
MNFYGYRVGQREWMFLLEGEKEKVKSWDWQNIYVGDRRQVAVALHTEVALVDFFPFFTPPYAQIKSKSKQTKHLVPTLSTLTPTPTARR